MKEEKKLIQRILRIKPDGVTCERAIIIRRMEQREYTGKAPTENKRRIKSPVY